MTGSPVTGSPLTGSPVTGSPPVAGPLIEATGVRRTYRRAPGFLARTLLRSEATGIEALRGVDLSITPGETVGLVGESGSGKSTFGRVILRLEPLDGGAVRYRGEPVHELAGPGLAAFRRRAQIVFQNPYASLNPRHSVRHILWVAFAAAGVERSERHDRAISLLRRVGLHERHLGAYPHQFSGGQRQRVAIARALAVGAEFLVLDEPTSALDVSIQAQVLALLGDLQAELGMTYLLISHNIAVVEAMADRIAVMREGRIVELGRSEQVIASPEHPYTKLLLDAVPRLAGAT